jgi:hypothetical protein
LREFLITRPDGNTISLHKSKFLEVLKPASFPSKQVSGKGEHRIAVNGCEISFTYEDPGILVRFEGAGLPDEEEEQIADEIAASITKATGKKVETTEF